MKESKFKWFLIQQDLLKKNERLSAFCNDPTINKLEKEGKAIITYSKFVFPSFCTCNDELMSTIFLNVGEELSSWKHAFFVLNCVCRKICSICFLTNQFK